MYLKVIKKQDAIYYILCVQQNKEWISIFLNRKQYEKLKSTIKVVVIDKGVEND